MDCDFKNYEFFKDGLKVLWYDRYLVRNGFGKSQFTVFFK